MTSTLSTGNTTNVTVAYAPFAADDWITFAHDFARTAYQTKATGLSQLTVSGLKLRWQANTGSGIYSSPLVYNNNVIIVTHAGTIVDYSATTGVQLWSTMLPLVPEATTQSSVAGTPTLDTVDGLIFIGTRQFTGTEMPAPSNFVAIQLNNGNVAWQATLPGIIRAAPVYVNGMVYEGFAGGDIGSCINGGLTAFNATTGARSWTYLVNPLDNPGGGGSVWGGIAYDGTHLIFGTGNACQANIATAQSAAALNLDGSVAWNFDASPQTSATEDDDIGGAVSVQNGFATFISKDGSIYRVSSTTGAEVWSTALGAADSDGGFASPGSDGNTTVIGAGAFPATGSSSVARSGTVPNMCMLRVGGKYTSGNPLSVTSGLMSYLKGIDSSGTVIWSVPMNTEMVNYPAIVNGLVFAGINDTLSALDLQSGAVVWSYATPSSVDAGAVVVPSGVYAADESGNVYAFALPASSLAAQSLVTRRR